jgi:flagellar hook-associated protein 2
MSTSSTSATTYFNGDSSYSAQLNNVIAQAVARATAPITQLQDEQSTLTNEQTEVQTLGNDFVAVQNAIDSLNSAVSTSSYTASVDTPSVATATATSSALPGTYALDVLSLGSQASAISSAGSTAVTDPSTQSISSSSSFTLTVNGTATTITPSGTSLDDLVSAINSSGADVQATLVNVGGSSADYRLSIQGTQYAAGTIQLTDSSGNSLLTTLNDGAPVTYTLNGEGSSSDPITSTSRTLTLSTGLTANVLATGTANITVAGSTASISTAINSFVTAYNAVTAELAKNRGENGGALTGNSLVSELQDALNSIGSYSSDSGTSSGVNALADLGLTFDETGNLDFDSSTFQAAVSASPSAVTAFLGSETTGGFLESAYSTLNSLTSATGSLTVAGNNIGASIESLTTQISNKQTQVSQLQTNLTTEMANADAAIASLQSQLSEITDLFSAENQVEQNINGVS